MNILLNVVKYIISPHFSQLKVVLSCFWPLCVSMYFIYHV